MNGKLKDSNVDFLFKAVLALENIDECYDFFEDLCTVTELKALSQRIVVAKMLSDKQVYSEIVSKTGASTARSTTAATDTRRYSSASTPQRPRRKTDNERIFILCPFL